MNFLGRLEKTLESSDTPDEFAELREPIPLHALQDQKPRRNNDLTYQEWADLLETLESHFRAENLKKERHRDDLEQLGARVEKFIRRFHDAKPPFEPSVRRSDVDSRNRPRGVNVRHRVRDGGT